MKFKLNFDIIKKHPVPIIGGLVLLFGIIYLVSSGALSGSSSTTAASTTSSTTDDALTEATNADNTQLSLASLQVTAQGNQLTEQLTQDAQDNAAQLSALTIQSQAAVTNATAAANSTNLANQLSAALQAHISDNNTSATEYGDSSQVAADQITANTTLGLVQAETNANVAIAGINSQTTLGVAADNAATLQTVAGYQAQVAETNSNNQVAVAKVNAGASETNGLLGLIGNIF